MGKVLNRGAQHGGVFVKASKANVALVTEQAANLAGRVVVVNMQAASIGVPSTSWLLADSTDTILGSKHVIPFCKADAVVELKSGGFGPLLSDQFHLGCQRVLRCVNGVFKFVYRMVVGIARAAWFVRYAGIKTVKGAAVLARLKDPSSGSFYRPRPEIVGFVSNAPLSKSSRAASLAGRIQAVGFLSSFRKLVQREKVLAVSTNLFAFFSRTISTFVPDMTKKAFGRNRFSAPLAFHYSLYRACVPGHADVTAAPNASVEFLINHKYMPFGYLRQGI